VPAALAFLPRDKLMLRTPVAAVSTYTFNRNIIRHHFCANCGIAPYSEAERKDGPMAAVNVRCLPDVDLETLTITKFDGKHS
jgi:hypothetical protein